MTPTDVLNVALGFHGAVFVGAATAYYKYGDRTEWFSKSLAGVEAALVQMRSCIADDLGQVLAPVFARAATDPSPLFDQSGDRYVERPVNAVGSEAYREAVREFCEAHSVAVMLHYRALDQSRARWLAWARWVSWTILALTVWELIACLGGGFFKLDEWPQTATVVWASFVPTTILIVALIVQLVVLQHFHDGVMEVRERYNAP